MENLNMLIVPDVHGRNFWKEPVKQTLESTTNNVIFLGDYLDPYPHEFEDPMDGTCDFDYRKLAIDRFKEILDLKKKYENRITLLLGNHDLGYIWSSICECRRDRINHVEISKLFSDNRNLFKIAHEEYINNKHFIFSHAGIGDKYMKRFGDDVTEDNVVKQFNKLFEEENYGFMDSLGYYDNYRGWGGTNNPSLVWADARGWIEGLQKGVGINIVGHTQIKHQLNHKDKYYFLDCQKCSYLDTDGNIRDYNSKEIIKAF